MPHNTCSIAGCNKKLKSRKMCVTHYRRWQRTGSPYRLCKTCGSSMDGMPATSLYCSKACKVCSVTGCDSEMLGRGYCSKHYARYKATGTPYRVCPTCGAPVEGGSAARYCGPDCRPRCCVEGCDRPYHSSEGYCSRHEDLIRRNGTPDPGSTEFATKADSYVCQACGAEFPDGLGSRRFCSSRCKSMWYKTRGDIPSLDFTCSSCGTRVERDRWSKKRQYINRKLCDQCSARRHSTHYRRKFPPEYLAARDGGDCRLCGNHVDLSLKWPDPMSSSIDHIVPVALGGTDDEENLQLTHLTCNCAKQARVAA